MKTLLYLILSIALFSCQNMEVKNLAADTVDDYNKLLADKPLVLVDFSATWCPPCKQLSPILDEVALEKKGDVEIVKIDVDFYPIISEAMKVDGIPSMFLYKNGEVIWQHVGLITKEELNSLVESNQ
ncbi:MAG: thioredoxin family protein [Bacteroidetes bacterium]|nr:thioredoxin family protein [Bacteroidota bacterium]